MREIKFRALAAVNDKRAGIKKGDMVYGQFIQSGIDAPCIIFGDGEQIEIDRKTLGQYIGKNTRYHGEIFEGDIVSSDFYLPEIKCIGVFVFGNAKFYVDSPEVDAFEYGRLTVIGNIHQNPELLEGES